MVRRGAFVVLAMAMLAWVRPAAAVTVTSEPVHRDGVIFSVSADLPADGVFVQEMVVVTVRAIFRDAVALADIDNPAFENARVARLGKDRWTRTDFNGPMGTGFERRIALFPQISGDLVIAPFVMRATVRPLYGAANTFALRSAGLTVPVKPALAEARGWWLPARGLRVTDEWQPDPENMPAGATARRTLTIEADAVNAVQLPPLPPLRSSGVITFAHPPTSATTIGPEGPVARAVFRWDVRSQIDTPALLKEIGIPWFDTTERRMRMATVPARTVSRLTAAETPAGIAAVFEAMFRPAVMAAAVAGFLIGVLALGCVALLSRPAVRARWSPEARARREALRAMRRAARRGEAAGVRAALSQLSLLDGAGGATRPAWLAEPEVAGRLANLDRFLYGATGAGRPDLAALCRAVARARRTETRNAKPPYAAPRAGLPPARLDGLSRGRP